MAIASLELTPTWLGKFFSSYKRVMLDARGLRVEDKSQHTKTIATYELLANLPELNNGIFWSTLTFQKINSHSPIRFGFLSKKQLAARFPEIVENCLPALILRINGTYATFEHCAISNYLRDSDIAGLDTSIRVLEPLAHRAELDSLLHRQLESMLSATPLTEHCDRLRSEYEERTLKELAQFYDQAESNPLTLNQRLAVIRNNDFNLVLAAAGTGKTSVMIAKALDLIHNHGVDPNEILVLAYNNSAAKELQQRYAQRIQIFAADNQSEPDIQTFHALGRRILKHANHSVHLSDLTQDPVKLNQWVTRWLHEQLRHVIAVLEKVFSLLYLPVDPFEFKTRAEYEDYVRDNEYRTLNGELVRGYQELLIANWLCKNGIPYKYEAVYVSKRRVAEGIDYKPDFYLTEANIYLEHFGIDRNGNTRPDIDRLKYNQEIAKKRALHKECGTTLIETYHYNWVENQLEARLAQLMEEHRVPLRPLNEDEILTKLNNNDLVSSIANVLFKSLQAIRTEQLDEVTIGHRLTNLNHDHADWCSQFLCQLHESYKEALREENAIDFDDMILLSQNAIKQGQFIPKWRHILVDEFQDISAARLTLVKNLIQYGPNPTLTAVGDDWQSIYRFSGGKLEITTRFSEYLGSHSLTKLDKTFRYNNSIAETAGTFVMENPEQYKKQVQTHTHVDEPQVYLLDTLVDDKAAPNVKVSEVVETIREHEPDASIAIICRYNYILQDIRKYLSATGDNGAIHYWTFHKSKGLEADYCILVGFFQGKTGFPNENKEQFIVEALLPSLDEYPHSEERRLFYVGLTRARKQSYIVADPDGISSFIKELLSPKYEINIASERFRTRFQQIFKCPKCTNGYLKLLQGPYGPFYRCTTGKGCSVRPRVCAACGSPTIDSWFHSVCNNPECRGETPICDKCGRPMRLREGKYGKFWGCSGYGIKDDQCRNTRKLGV